MVNEKYNHWLPPLLGADGVTIGNTIYYRQSESRVSPKLRRHEMVHIEQYQQLGMIGFFLTYFGEYLSYRLQGQSHWEAYRNISLEKEAYRKQEVR